LAAIVFETNDVVIAEIDLNADGKHKQPSAYLTDGLESYIYFEKGTVKFHDLPFENSVDFCRNSIWILSCLYYETSRRFKKYRFLKLNND
jgi:hypothetical protein